MSCFHKVFMIIVFHSVILPTWVVGKQQVPCYFIFGDSLVDNGNNNHLVTFAKAIYLPHGIDFSSGPTGRFCNGRTFADFMAEHLGFNSRIPPFALSNGSDILLGLNYASAAAGIRSETGHHLGDRITFDQQLKNHEMTVSSIREILGEPGLASQYLKKCLYHVGFGSNDYLNNYFIPAVYETSSMFTVEKFTQVLIQQYRRQILTLYSYGARKVSLNGLGPVGCTPYELSRHSTNESCVEYINTAVQLFNHNLKLLVDELNNDTSLQDAKFIYLNFYDMSMEVIRQPSAFGFTVANSGCCGTGLNNGALTCLPFEVPCLNRSEYFFWDAYHTTEAANRIASKRSYLAINNVDVYPIDIYHLVQL
ncbi:GDSL esterase/lipase At1g29670 [Lactuca sativa]|uniref:GDSL esterase/lipase At1g29670 n=1 Tax=Lactuca sativa TaxID=4236 RepID=UPI000CC62664|nr:GDSL esterase/lipase At1g29670 [Lactuca sativa]